MRNVVDMSFISPNFNDRPASAEIDTIVMHYTGMKTGEEALKRLCDPASKVSSHYMIQEDGEIITLVHEEKRAWHAGSSHWRGRDNVNDFSIGIELVNPGHEFGYKEFPGRQMDSLLRLCEEIIVRHPIEARNIVGHSDVAPDRKEDPGELFDWELLASHNIGIWPDMPAQCGNNDLLKPGDSGQSVKTLQENLRKFGYGINADGEYGTHTCHVSVAFQRRFTPLKIGGIWHKEADTALKNMLITYCI